MEDTDCDLTSTSTATTVRDDTSLSSVEWNDTHDYLTNVASVNNNVYVPVEVDHKQYQAKLGWMPLNVIKKTLEHTTQLAKNYINLPLKRHFKSRFPELNRNRLQETYCTDTFFSSVTGIHNITCAQLFLWKR